VTSFRVAYDDFKSLRAPKWRLVMPGFVGRPPRPPRPCGSVVFSGPATPGRARVRTQRSHRRYDPALAGVWNTLGWIMNRKNTAAVAADDGTHRGFNPGPSNHIHPCEGLLPVRASPVLLGVVCGPEWTADGMPAKRNPRESEKRMKKRKRNKEEVEDGTRRRGPSSYARILRAAVRLVLLMCPRLVLKINVLSLLRGNSRGFRVYKIYVIIFPDQVNVDLIH